MEPGNAMLLGDGSVVPLYRVSDPAAATRAVGFVHDGDALRALDEDGGELWHQDVGAGALFGGFDFDADGWPDLGLARSEDTGKACGDSTILSTWVDLLEGRTGKLYSPAAPLESICWTFPSTTYPTHQWSSLGVLFGAGTKRLGLMPYYATTGWFFDFEAGAFSTIGSFAYPSTSSYDATYLDDQPNAFGTGTSYGEFSHVANGMMLVEGGQERLAFFTSARVVQYAASDIGASQLLADTPYLTGGRTDIVGRNYGLVVRDPEYPQHLILIAGTGADTIFSDMTTGTMESDPWGGIERHVSVYDLASSAVDDRYFSFAHDAMDGHKYEGRVVYPDGPIVRRGAGSPSRIAFNVYEGGHWRLHVTEPGNTIDALVLPDLFLWDIRDVDGDGRDDWILSPSRDPGEPDVPGYYYLKWRTQLAHWDETGLGIIVDREVMDAIPLLAATFRLPEKTSSRSYLYPSLTARQGGAMSLLLWTSDKVVEPLPLGR